MEEIFTVYNEHGKAIGMAKRSTCHKKGLIHGSVYILLFNNKHQLFLQKRSMAKYLYPGYYTASASGHIHHKETPLQAAKRELYEELGIKAKLNFVCKFRTFLKNDREIGYVYKCTYTGLTRPNTREIIKSKSRFFNLNEIKNLKSSPHLKDCLKAFKSHIQNQRRFKPPPHTTP